MKINQFLLLIFISNNAFSQIVEHINTDRPDQSDGVYIVHPKIFQLETGFIFNKLDEHNQSFVHTSMLRYGLFKRTELRLVVEEGIENNQYYHSDASGLYPLALSTKISLVKHKARPARYGRGIMPDITAIAYARFPFTASKNFKPKYYSSTFLFSFQHHLSEKLVLGYNSGVLRSSSDKTISYPVTGVLIYSPSPHISFFGEYFAWYQQKTLPSNNADIGFLYIFKPNMQVDIAVGTSLKSGVNSNYVTMGFSYRFD